MNTAAVRIEGGVKIRPPLHVSLNNNNQGCQKNVYFSYAISNQYLSKLCNGHGLVALKVSKN